MAKMESVIKSEIVRLSTREMRKVWVPLRREVRLLKGLVSQLRKSFFELRRLATQQEKQKTEKKPVLGASPEEVKKSRFSPRLLRSLRKHLGITQRELAILAGVTIGAIQKWEAGKFRPKNDKMAVLVGLRKLGRGGVRKLLDRGTE